MGCAAMTAAHGTQILTYTVPPRARRHYPWRVVLAVVVLAVLAFFCQSLAANQKVGWGQVGAYLFNGTILSGVVTTIELTIVCQAIGIVLGVIFGLCRISANPVLSTIAAAYSWLFRGTPVLVQLIMWFNFGLLFPRLAIGIPFTSANVSVQTNSVITAFVASVLALGLNEGAYMMEIVRGGVLSVSKGQTEAALALGMTPRKAMLRIVLPQTLPAVIPPTGNQLIQMLKATSLVAFVAGGDLLTRAQAIYSNNFAVIPLLIVASLWYLLMTLIASLLQQVLEARVNRSRVQAQRRGPRRHTERPAVHQPGAAPEASP
jgi:polar amino acid transport system permease protein